MFGYFLQQGMLYKAFYKSAGNRNRSVGFLIDAAIPFEFFFRDVCLGGQEFFYEEKFLSSMRYGLIVVSISISDC
jgi:hypothetical protein